MLLSLFTCQSFPTAQATHSPQPPLQLVTQAGLQQSSSGVRPAAGLARPARDVVRAVALGGHLLPRPAAAAVHARTVRVLVGARGLVAAGPARPGSIELCYKFALYSRTYFVASRPLQKDSCLHVSEMC
jgi:hypothetical protein